MNELTDSFFLTLPSWGTSNIYSSNNAGDFICQLGQPQDLRGSWEVSLKNLFLRKLWYNINDGENQFTVGEKGTYSNDLTWKTYAIPAREYQTKQELLDKLNRFSVAKFEYSDILKTVTVKIIDPDTVKRIIFADGLSMTLGFPPGYVIDSQEETAPYLMQLDKPREFVLITCDLVEPRSVGANTWGFLKLIQTSSSSFGDQFSEVFEAEYVPLDKKTFDRVRISVRDIYNNPLPFHPGHTLVTLHFRRI